jgi:hypothetical protein
MIGVAVKECCKRLTVVVPLQNLHVAVLLNPANPSFAMLLQRNPAIATSSLVFQLPALTTAQERAVTRHAAADAFAGEARADQQIAKLDATLQAIHNAAAEHVPTAPQHFRALIAQSVAILVDRRKSMTDKIAFLKVRSCLPWRFGVLAS